MSIKKTLTLFPCIAEDLKLKGINGQKDVNETMMKPNQREIGPDAACEKLISNTIKSNFVFEQDTFTSESSQERTLSVQNFVPGVVQELDAKVKSLMEESQNISSNGSRASTCKVCGKEGQMVAIRDHIEIKHLEGVSLPCDVCGKICTSRNMLRRHKYQCKSEI